MGQTSLTIRREEGDELDNIAAIRISSTCMYLIYLFFVCLKREPIHF